MLKHGVPGASLDTDLNIKEELSPFFVSPSSTQLNNHFYIPQAVASNSGVKKTENHRSNITVFCLSFFYIMKNVLMDVFAACLVVLTLAPDISQKTTAELRRHSSFS